MRHKFQLLFGLLLIAAIIVGAFFALRWFFGFVFSLEDKAEATVIGGLIAFALALFAFWKEIQKSRNEAHREKKVVVYKNFSGIIFEMLRSVNEGEDTTDFVNSDKFKEKMWALKEGILFYGSPSVIKTFNLWMKSHDENASPTPAEVMRPVGAVLLAMRKDLGLSNFGLDSLSIHQIYVTDDLEKI